MLLTFLIEDTTDHDGDPVIEVHYESSFIGAGVKLCYRTDVVELAVRRIIAQHYGDNDE